MEERRRASSSGEPACSRTDTTQPPPGPAKLTCTSALATTVPTTAPCAGCSVIDDICAAEQWRERGPTRGAEQAAVSEWRRAAAGGGAGRTLAAAGGGGCTQPAVQIKHTWRGLGPLSGARRSGWTVRTTEEDACRRALRDPVRSVSVGCDCGQAAACFWNHHTYAPPAAAVALASGLASSCARLLQTRPGRTVSWGI